MSKLLLAILTVCVVGCHLPPSVEGNTHPEICASNGVVYHWSDYRKMYITYDDLNYCLPTKDSGSAQQ